jgi:hypothetical protein
MWHNWVILYTSVIVYFKIILFKKKKKGQEKLGVYRYTVKPTCLACKKNPRVPGLRRLGSLI